MPARLHLPATTRPALPAELLEDLSSLRVLIVDDDPKFRRTMRRGLEELGIRCAAADGADAADGLLSEPGARFDVILLDVMMPAREDQTPVICLTARQEVEERTTTV
jgi:DNA-binding response OmpR family regulator